jgi:hypothetical protein
MNMTKYLCDEAEAIHILTTTDNLVIFKKNLTVGGTRMIVFDVRMRYLFLEIMILRKVVKDMSSFDIKH